MFNSLKEKLTSWFKKPEVKEQKPEEEKEKPSETKEKIKKKEKISRKIKKEKQEKKGESAEKTTKKIKEIPENTEEAIQEIPQQIEKKTTEHISEPLEKTEPLKEIIPEESLEKSQEEIIELPVEKIEEKPEEKKEGFFKKIFSKKKKESPEEINLQMQEQITETIKEEIKPEEPKLEEQKQGFFSKLASKLSTSTLTQEQFDELFEELQITLLENNVALEVVEKIHGELSKDLVGVEIKKSKIQETIINSLKETIFDILIEPSDLIKAINKKLGVYIIIFVGINGSGKTTSVAKLAHYLKKNNISCVFAAGDTFRAASIEQLQQHAEKLNIPIIKHQYGSDPAAVAFDAKKYAESHNIKVVLIDTAGRMHTKTNLIKEMEKIVRVSKPDLKIFVGESITGNDVVEQARTFNEAIDIDGIILSKADVDEKAGAILSVSYVTKKPIYFLGTGQSYDDLTPFTKSTMLKNLGLE